MKQITSEDFRKAVNLDPAWASTLTEPVEITGFCEMTRSAITHLSPLLHFIGNDGYGNCAEFMHCKNLKIAEGTFLGFVDFSRAGIEKIGDLNITQIEPWMEYLRLESTPILESNPQSVVQQLWGEKSIAELKAIPISEYDEPLVDAIQTIIRQRRSSMERKNQAVEIQID